MAAMCGDCGSRRPRKGNGRICLRGEGGTVATGPAGLHRGEGTWIHWHPSEQSLCFRLFRRHAVFPMGDTCYGLFDDSPITAELRALYLKTRQGAEIQLRADERGA